MVLEMVGGPFAGLIHEVDEHVPVPVSIGLMKRHMRHWYMVDADAGVARYSHCEAELGLHGGPSERDMAQAQNRAMMVELGWFVCKKCHMSRPPNLMSEEQARCKLCGARRD